LIAYTVAIIPAWLLAGVDWALSAKPTYFRIVGTAVAAALIGDSIAFFLWGGLRELFPALMAGLVGAVPAAACSWLSGKTQGSGFDEWKARNMSLTTLRIAMWLALVSSLGCGFFMAYSLMFIAAALLCFLVLLVLVFVVGSKDGSNARRAAWGDSSRKDTWKTK
jgi:hypothetical protein